MFSTQFQHSAIFIVIFLMTWQHFIYIFRHKTLVKTSTPFFETRDQTSNIMNEDMLKLLKELAAWDFIPKAMIVCVLGNLINFVILSRYTYTIDLMKEFSS